MANPKVKILRTVIPGQVPSSLEIGELAINHADVKLYAGKSSGNVIVGVSDIVQSGINTWSSNVDITGGTISGVTIAGIGGDVLLASIYDPAAIGGILLCSQYDPGA